MCHFPLTGNERKFVTEKPSSQGVVFCCCNFGNLRMSIQKFHQFLPKFAYACNSRFLRSSMTSYSIELMVKYLQQLATCIISILFSWNRLPCVQSLFSLNLNTQDTVTYHSSAPWLVLFVTKMVNMTRRLQCEMLLSKFRYYFYSSVSVKSTFVSQLWTIFGYLMTPHRKKNSNFLLPAGVRFSMQQWRFLIAFL